MDGGTNGIDNEEKVAARSDGQEGTAQENELQAVGSDDYGALLTKREWRIRELEGWVAKVIKTTEAEGALRGEIRQAKAKRSTSA